MKYHRFRFGLIGNVKVLICRIFGHRLNDNPGHHWCGRCCLAYEECYNPLNYFHENKQIYIRAQRDYDKNYQMLANEMAVRTHIALPTTEEELKFWDEGTDHKKCYDFIDRLDKLRSDQIFIL